MRKAKFFLWIMMGFPWPILAQENDHVASIKIMARPQKDKIMLRWAPDKPLAWELCNQWGYSIERITLIRNDSLLQEPERILLANKIIRPWPEEQWTNLALENDYAAIAAQAIMGEEFNVVADFDGDFSQIVQRAQELESRFSYALFAADQSIETAKASGLFWEDLTALPNEKYLYRVYSHVPSSKYILDTAFVFTGISEFKSLPSIDQPYLQANGMMVSIEWDVSTLGRYYNSFTIERSIDSVNFIPITERPIVNPVVPGTGQLNKAYKVDTLGQLGRSYWYRIKGHTAFGEHGPYSVPVAIKGRYKIKANPVIVSQITQVGPQVELTWEFPEDEEKYLKGFIVKRSNNGKAPFKTVSSLDPTQRKGLDVNPLLDNYYKVVAFTDDGLEKESFLYFVAVIDSIPPNAPQGLSAKIDSSGIVKLTWQPNNELDIKGYRIYRSNYQSEEYSLLNGESVSEASYTDTITLKTLSSTIYYKTRAIDHRENESTFSSPLEIKKPDIVPPAPPAFKKIGVYNGYIMLEFEPSSSEDVDLHLLYRRVQGTEEFILLAMLQNRNPIIYEDQEIERGITYEYVMIASDQSGLESVPTQLCRQMVLRKELMPAIKFINAHIDRENNKVQLEWAYEQQNIKGFWIYRSVGGEDFRLVEIVRDRIFIDELQSSTEISYKILAEYNNGEISSGLVYMLEL